MFNSLTGIITGKFPKQIFIDTNGVEWDLCVPDSNLDMLPPVGNEARVFTWLQHTDQLMTLYGFASAEERSVFLDLLKVDGVGPKGAVKIMSSVSSSRLLDVLERGDLEMLEKIPGVGKKTAGKMILTLKGKLTLRDSSAGDVVRLAAASPYADVVLSLAYNDPQFLKGRQPYITKKHLSYIFYILYTLLFRLSATTPSTTKIRDLEIKAGIGISTPAKI